MSTNVVVPARQTDGPTEAMLEALTELTSRAGHDMVGPLNQAGSLLALFIKRYKDSLDSDAEQLLGFLHSASVRMEGVVNGLRDYMEAIGHLPVCSAVDLNDVLARAKERSGETGALIESEPLPVVWADREQVAFVFQQLIDNAAKFRNPEEQVRITVSAARDGDIVAIKVHDEGIGIDPEQGENIFLPFRRLNGREYPGAGLGLAAVKAIVAMHGGVARLAGSGPGTTIEFTLRAS